MENWPQNPEIGIQIPAEVAGQTIPINMCQRFLAPILHCSFYVIELKELSALTSVAQWRRHMTVDLRAWTMPGFNLQPSLNCRLFLFCYPFFPNTEKYFFRTSKNKKTLTVEAAKMVFQSVNPQINMHTKSAKP